MNLDETRGALKKVFEDKLSKALAQILKGQVDTKGDSHAPIRKVEDVILEYLDCGGTIESGSTFEFAKKVIEESGFYINGLGVRDFLNIRDGVEGILTFDEAVERNSNLTLGEMRNILSRRYQLYKYDISKQLEYMREFVQCGGIIEEAYVFIGEIKKNPEYLKLYEEIQAKSRENKTSREAEKSPLQQREGQLSSLEAEEKKLQKL